MSKATGEVSFFSTELFAFLRELKAHNDRESLAEGPLRERPARAGTRLHRGLRAAPAADQPAPGGRRASPGRGASIYRDTRFSRDKSPYKTQAGIYFRHERSKEAYSPGLYLHLEPRERVRRRRDVAARTRRRPTPSGRRWPRTPTAGGARPAAAPSRSGSSSAATRSSASRRWADPEHPFADDLRRKDFFGWARLERGRRRRARASSTNTHASHGSAPDAVPL